MQGSYTRGEVLLLLSLSRDQAVDLDATPPDSLGHLSAGEKQVRRGAEDADVMVIARWQDVQRVKRTLAHEKAGLAILQLRASGFSETEIARLSGRERLAVRRRWHATLDEILLRLGGTDDEPAARAVIEMCLICGDHPRARLEEITRRVRGGRKTVAAARQAAVCISCLSPALLGRVAPVAA